MLDHKIIATTESPDVATFIKYEYEFALQERPYSGSIVVTDSDLTYFRRFVNEDGSWLYSAWYKYLPSIVQQRLGKKYLLLHGSCVVRDDCADVFLGSTLSGKTTIAITAIENSYHILADDIIAVRLEDKIVFPFVKPIIIRKWLMDYARDFLPNIYGKLKPFVEPGTNIKIPGEGAYFQVKDLKHYIADPAKLRNISYLSDDPRLDVKEMFSRILPCLVVNTAEVVASALRLFNQFEMAIVKPPTLKNYKCNELMNVIMKGVLCSHPVL